MKRVGRIYACQPGYLFGNAASHRQFWIGTLKQGSPYHGRVTLRASHDRSLLAQNFNSLFAEALSRRLAGEDITHFAMLHDDIAPQEGWLDVLMEDLISSGADLMAAIVPIKDPIGLSSTAISNPGDTFAVERRITMNEANRALPDVFSIEDCGYSDRYLLANTGCWVCDLNNPIFTQTDDRGRLKIFFTINDEIRHVTGGSFCIKDLEGNFVDGLFTSREGALCKIKELDNPDLVVEEHSRYSAFVEPEDWFFSRRVGEMGGKVMVTKRVILNHFGMIPYANQGDWGRWDYDQHFGYRFGHKPITGRNNGDDNGQKEDERIAVAVGS